MTARSSSKTHLRSTSSLLLLLTICSPVARAYILPSLAQSQTTPALPTLTSFPQAHPQAPGPQPAPSSWAATTATYTLVNGTTITHTGYTNCPTDPAQPPVRNIYTILSGTSTAVVTLTQPACTGYAGTPNLSAGSDSGLSSGALAGIAVGISLPVLAAIIFVFYRLRQRRRSELSSSTEFHRDHLARHRADSIRKNLTTADTDEVPIRPGRTPDPDIRLPTNVVTRITAG
ncbi:hypothetical protein DRE_04458 [Drechslerella stenobrocha 248]|uniref:Mid2 domain-containing protein n=1 Tax=Drechslerella stenobrocha 248 TaxID=1043628 RepID=W7I190_9PEZI|nr:hypothetical protein DRE_04458 [Drechslerella stenobrocha 248]